MQTLFWEYGIDDGMFHACVKSELAHFSAQQAAHPSQCPSSPHAVVVGVEWGTEVIELATMGFRVTGVEPFPQYVANVTAAAADAGVLDKISIHSAGAGRERGRLNISYYDGSVSTNIITVDDIVKNETIDVCSVDVHGGANNFDVLVGGKKALERQMFKMIWVELFPDDVPSQANGWGRKLIDLLIASNYVLYDLKWSGGWKSCKETGTLPHHCGDIRSSNLALKQRRSLTSSESYMNAMYVDRAKNFQYLQTDIVAVPLSGALLADRAFQKAAVKCSGNTS